jgi:hypothetical protein
MMVVISPLVQDHYLQQVYAKCPCREALLTAPQIVSPLKDVEGLHFKFHYNLYHKSALFPILLDLYELT